MLVLCTIFFKLTKYLYFHNHSINIFYNIYKFKWISDLTSNKYVNSTL